MKQPTSLLLYQDEPASGRVLRVILLVVPAIMFITGLYLWFSREGSESLGLLVISIPIGLVLWIILPQKYQVFEDRLCIVLGGPLAINVGYNQITFMEVTTRNALTLNLVSTITRTYVIIGKKKGMSIAITPERNELFVENASRALSHWRKNNLSSHL
jgi:hypothetical protein